MTKRVESLALMLVAAACLAGCAGGNVKDPIRTVDYVDLDKFMGDWFVIANIPTFVEKGAHNAVESYERVGEDKIATTFTFRKGGFDGDKKEYNPTGFVQSEDNSVWGMQFIWPFKGDYRIVYLTDDYDQTVIGRNKRDYVWIMARQPSIPDRDYQQILEMLDQEGYDISKVQKVPQRW